MKNCPYCNAEAKRVVADTPLVELTEVREMGAWMYAVKCNQCLAKGPAFHREDQALAAWDTAPRRDDARQLSNVGSPGPDAPPAEIGIHYYDGWNLEFEITNETRPLMEIYTRGSLAASHARLVKAMSNISDWILNWEPNFTDDPEWYDRDQIEFEKALASAKSLTGEGE